MKGYFSRLMKMTGIGFEPTIPPQNAYGTALKTNPDKDSMPIHEVEENKIIEPTNNVQENNYESDKNIKTYASSNLLPKSERYSHQKETRLEKYGYVEQTPPPVTFADISLSEKKEEQNQDLKKNLASKVNLKDSTEKETSSNERDLPIESETISIKDSKNTLHPKENVLSKVVPLQSENFKNEILNLDRSENKTDPQIGLPSSNERDSPIESETISIKDSKNTLHPKENVLSKVVPLQSENFKNEILNLDRSENKTDPQIGLPTFLQVREWVSSKTSVIETGTTKPDSINTSEVERILPSNPSDKAIDNVSSYLQPLESQKRVEPEITNYQIDIGSINLTIEAPPNAINQKNPPTSERRRTPDSKGDNSRLKRHYIKL